MFKKEGREEIFINALGAFDRHELGRGERWIVEHSFAALSDACQYNRRMFGRLKPTILMATGVSTEVTGPVAVYIQTTNIREFVDGLWRCISPKAKSGALSEAVHGEEDCSPL